MKVDDALLQLEKITSGSVPTPPSNSMVLFADSATGNFSQKNSSGLITDLTSGGGGGGGGGFTSGTTVIDFGAFPGSQEASVAVTNQTGIVATSAILLSVSASDSTTDHTANDHSYLLNFANFVVEGINAGEGFTIIGRAIGQLQGTFKIKWSWG